MICSFSYRRKSYKIFPIGQRATFFEVTNRGMNDYGGSITACIQKETRIQE